MRYYAAVKNFKDEEDLLELIWSDFQDKCLSEKCKAHQYCLQHVTVYGKRNIR